MEIFLPDTVWSVLFGMNAVSSNIITLYNKRPVDSISYESHHNAYPATEDLSEGISLC